MITIFTLLAETKRRRRGKERKGQAGHGERRRRKKRRRGDGKTRRRLWRKKSMEEDNKRRTRTRGRSASVSDSCFEQTVTIMKMWKDIISNFEKQKKRMEKQNGTGGNKSGKKGEYIIKALFVVLKIFFL